MVGWWGALGEVVGCTSAPQRVVTGREGVTHLDSGGSLLALGTRWREVAWWHGGMVVEGGMWWHVVA